jgi:hypothetical protein
MGTLSRARVRSLVYQAGDFFCRDDIAVETHFLRIANTLPILFSGGMTILGAKAKRKNSVGNEVDHV